MGNVIKMIRKCPHCRATLARVSGKWWCVYCQRFVKPKKG